MRIQPYRFNTLKIRSRGYLPHWEVDNSFYFVTYRLADSIPRDVAARLAGEKRAIERRNAGDEKAKIVQRAEIARLYGLAIDRELDRGYGACHLAQQNIAAIVAETFVTSTASDMTCAPGA